MNRPPQDALLVGLLYDELDTEQKREAEELVAHSSEARRLLEQLTEAKRLADQLPQEEVPDHARAAILQAAREAAAPPGRDVASDLTPEPSPWKSFLRWVGGFAVGPQVAMATVMLLVVAIGLWYVPSSRRNAPPSVGETIASTDLEAEVQSTLPASSPPESATGEGSARSQSAALPAAAPPEENAARPAHPEPAETKTLRAEKPARRRARLDPPSELRGSGGAGLGRGSLDPRPKRSASAGAFAPPPPGPRQEERIASSARPAADQAGAVTGAHEDDLADAPSGRGAPHPTYSRARALRKGGDCRQAIPLYERHVQRAPRSATAAAALLELADCYRRTGQRDRAIEVYRRAEREHPSVANQARRERAGVEAESTR